MAAQKRVSPTRRQLPLNRPVEVEGGGKRHTVQVIMATDGSAHLGAPPPDKVPFRVVLLTNPVRVEESALKSNRVLVCIPSAKLPAAAIAETRASYKDGSTAEPWVWSPQQARTFARGVVMGSMRAGVDAAELFAGGDALAQVLDEELAGFRRHLLSETTVGIPLASLVRGLQGRFATLEEGQVEEFAGAIGEAVRAEIEKARASHRGKQIRLKIV